MAPQWARHLVALEADDGHAHPSPLSGTRDLVSLFHLEPVYDTFLRPYLPPVSTNGTRNDNEDKGKDKHAPIPADPHPASPSPAPTPSSGLKITLGGIKFGSAGGSGQSAGGDSADGPSGQPGPGAPPPDKKRKRPRMDKTYEYMVGDVLGRISHPRTASTAAPNNSSLLHLVSNPDPAPCPPLHQLDPAQLRDAFTLRPGQLAGFDMTLWEARSTAPASGGGLGERKKRKKRKHDDAPGSGGGAGDPKKQRR
ncbi:hypothetical protein JCM3770_001779 [Rhodotorula araucariae]